MKFEDIVNEWQKQFPVLTRYTSCTLFAKADILLIGLRFDKVEEKTYRIYLECVPLWTQELNISFPFLFVELHKKNGLQFFIEYNLHERLFKEAVECVEEQFGRLLRRTVDVRDIFHLVDYNSTIYTKHNPVDWVPSFEFKLAVAVYFKDTYLENRIKRDIEKETKHWDEEHFHNLFRKSVQQWKEELYQRMDEREILVENVRSNLTNKKVEKLKEINLEFIPFEPKTLWQSLRDKICGSGKY